MLQTLAVQLFSNYFFQVADQQQYFFRSRRCTGMSNNHVASVLAVLCRRYDHHGVRHRESMQHALSFKLLLLSDALDAVHVLRSSRSAAAAHSCDPRN